jgi:kynurenine formamidase
MRSTDISGPVFQGMWTYGGPYGEVESAEVEQLEVVEHETYSWRMAMSVQSGTYLETSLHVKRDGPPLIDIALEDLWMRNCAILRAPKEPDGCVQRAELEACGVEIKRGDAIIVATGWDSHWREGDFISNCPWFSREAMDWILDHEPFMLCGDVPRFDSWEEPQGFWPRFFDQGTLLLAPVVNLAAVRSDRAKLCALPMKLEESCAAPCRAVIVEE